MVVDPKFSCRFYRASKCDMSISFAPIERGTPMRVVQFFSNSMLYILRQIENICTKSLNSNYTTSYYNIIIK